MPPGDASADPPEELLRRSMRLSGHPTSVSLERAFWQALDRFAAEDGRSTASIIEEIDRRRTQSLSRTVRVYILERTQAVSGTDPIS